MHSRIVSKLDVIESQYQVKLLFVAESGSRAWGFSSQDSDYDVRGIFIQPRERYLSMDEEIQTFEWIEDHWFDVGGWDLRKALRLLRKSNAVLLEWLQSPIIYLSHDEIHRQILDLSEIYFQPRAVVYHYRGIAKSSGGMVFDGEVKLKKWFYVLRTLLAAFWTAKEKKVPPMALENLLLILPSTLQEEIRELVDFKADKDESFLWTPTNTLRSLIDRLWCETAIELPTRAIPDAEMLNQWFVEKLDEFND